MFKPVSAFINPCTALPVAFFVMVLPYSDATFVMAFERECTETFWEGHVRAFEFFKGVPTRIW